jgi:EmrB/QacA subfamily drug resistance transporter
MTLTIIGDILSPRERGRYQGYIGAVFAVSSVAGPLLGGFIVDNFSWRWIFYINLPIGLAALFVTAAVLKIPFHRREHAIDYLGAALLVAAVSAALLVTVWGGREYAWGSGIILGLAVLAIVLFALFLLHERRAAEPIIPLRLFGNRVFSITSGMGFILGLAMFGGIIFLPLFLQVVLGESATNSGLLLVPLMAGLLSTSIASGRVISRTGHYKRYPIAGTAILTVGLYLLSTMDQQTSLALASLYMVVLGMGMGLILQVLVIAVQNAVETSDLGVATSSATFFRSLGGAFGTALFGAILSSRLVTELAGLIPEGSVNDLTSSPQQIAQLPPEVHQVVVGGLSNAITSVFLAAVPFALVALVLALILPELPLRDTVHTVPASAEGILEDST